MNISMSTVDPFEQPPMPEQPHMSDNNTRIVGGQHSIIDHAPFTVAIRLFYEPICGGTIITPNYVITSAHCVCYPGIAILTLLAGSSTRSGRMRSMRVINRININQNYNPRTLQGDVAVLRTNNALPIDHRTIAIARLPPPGLCEQVPINQIGIIAGWWSIFFLLKFAFFDWIIYFQGYDGRKQRWINVSGNTNYENSTAA